MLYWKRSMKNRAPRVNSWSLYITHLRVLTSSVLRADAPRSSASSFGATSRRSITRLRIHPRASPWSSAKADKNTRGPFNAMPRAVYYSHLCNEPSLVTCTSSFSSPPFFIKISSIANYARRLRMVFLFDDLKFDGFQKFVSGA
jgi:hypothetical protein